MGSFGNDFVTTIIKLATFLLLVNKNDNNFVTIFVKWVRIMLMNDGYTFWKRVDELLGDRSLLDLASGTGLNYGTIKNQRSSNRVPKSYCVQTIAEYLNTTTSFLLSENTNGITLEMEFVRDNPLCRKIVRYLMEDEHLLEVVAAFVESSERRMRQVESERKEG